MLGTHNGAAERIALRRSKFMECRYTSFPFFRRPVGFTIIPSFQWLTETVLFKSGSHLFLVQPYGSLTLGSGYFPIDQEGNPCGKQKQS
jgi:hypothetical protein